MACVVIVLHPKNEKEKEYERNHFLEAVKDVYCKGTQHFSLEIVAHPSKASRRVFVNTERY